ncbi:MAG: hypothetical protein NVS2B8_15390 [Vulcanimicrobiaceae bacterium]
MSSPHPPRSDEPVSLAALDSDALVRDLPAGRPTPLGTWIAQRMRAESRSRDECRDELINAIARGDVAVERAGDASDR